MILAFALTRADIGRYVNALFEVYILLIFIYILTNWMLSFGVRMPYHRVVDAIINFLRDVCEPYLRLFRRFIPPLGMIDITPIIAIIVLYIVDRLVVGAIGT
jgi:YggT family protein